jgi:uncharacterized small protein (DUF1192 family)
MMPERAMFNDEDGMSPDKARNAIIPGEDLSALSLDDLAERKALCEAEITRIDAMVQKKQASHSAADAVFKF